jgi:DNA polymerase elongation subunit (family B)
MNPPNDIFRGLIVDYDQTSMYPSIDVMFNIDYTTLRARVYPLFSSTFIKTVLTKLYHIYMHEFSKFTDTLFKFENIWKNICDIYSEIYSPPGNNKTEFRNYNADFTTKLILRIFKNAKAKGYTDIVEYIKQADYFSTLAYIYPLFENMVHILSVFESEINPVAYFYLVTSSTDEYIEWIRSYYDDMIRAKAKQHKQLSKFLNNIIDNSIEHMETFVIIEPANNMVRFDTIGIEELPDTLFKDYIVTPTGTLFNRHDDKLSVQTKFITTFMKLRKQIQKRAAEVFEQGQIELSEELERSQLAIKILLNSISYGISILPSYVFNDKNIANTITITGRFMIKFAQYHVDKHIHDLIKTFA